MNDKLLEIKGGITAILTGLWHKSGMILVVLVAAITDGVFAVVGDHFALGINWTGLLLPLTLAWYIITEIGSILEDPDVLGTMKNPLRWAEGHEVKAGYHYTDGTHIYVALEDGVPTGTNDGTYFEEV